MNDCAEMISGLSFPTSLIVEGDGSVIIAESGLSFGGATSCGRILRYRNGNRQVLVDGLRPPVTGVTKVGDDLIVSEGGHPARLAKLGPDGALTTIVDGFVGPGNYHVGTVAASNDGWLYFGVGSMTNSGVVGPDGLSIGWLRRLRHAPDVPGVMVGLRGQNFEATDPATGHIVATGAFRPFGTPAEPREQIAPGRMSTAAVYRCRPNGSDLELVAWGIRNAFGIGFLDDGRLLAVDQGADDRGLRPLAEVPDFLWEIHQGQWYGWPDFMGGVPVTDPSFRPKRGPSPEFLLLSHSELGEPKLPLVRFPAHSAATKFAQIPNDSDVWPRCLLVALFGDERPMTAPEGPKVGRTLVKIDPQDWSTKCLKTNGVLRPIDVAVVDSQVLILDFGEFEIGTGGEVHATPGTGSVRRAALADLAS